MNRILFGEHVDQMILVSEIELSEVLSEAARLVKDLEDDNAIFTISQAWNAETELYELLIFVRR